MSIYAITSLARNAAAALVLPHLLRGSAIEAARCADIHVQCAKAAGPDSTDIALACGDLMLAQDRDEEAEEAYRRAVGLSGRDSRGQVRVVSCRATGMLNLYRQRYGTAVSCFRRIVEDDAANAAQRVEACCALAYAYHGMGQVAQAGMVLDEAAEAAAEANGGRPVAGVAEPLTALALLLGQKNCWTNFSAPSIFRDGRTTPDQTHVSNS